jgi:hypothetical protein
VSFAAAQAGAVAVCPPAGHPQRRRVELPGPAERFPPACRAGCGVENVRACSSAGDGCRHDRQGSRCSRGALLKGLGTTVPLGTRRQLCKAASPASSRCLCRRNGRNWHDSVALRCGPRPCGMCRALLAAGASIDAVDSNGNTALARAATRGRVPCLEALLAAGADKDAVNQKSGMTVLHRAVIGHQPAPVRCLAEAGADLTEWDHKGRTPMELAQAIGDHGLARLLQQLERAARARKGVETKGDSSVARLADCREFLHQQGTYQPTLLLPCRCRRQGKATTIPSTCCPALSRSSSCRRRGSHGQAAA